MTEVWKSQGRKYCKFCDCWFADNKVSISFHENGKRHKESVEKKVQEISKKGTEREKALKDEKKLLEAMEKGAAKAIEKDIKENPRMISHYFGDEVEVPLPDQADGDAADPPVQGPAFPAGDGADPPIQGPALPPLAKKRRDDKEVKKGPKLKANQVWQEVQAPEGYSYYWNVETGQVTWTAPPGGYVPMARETDAAAGSESSKTAPVEDPKIGAGLVHRKSWKERAYGDWNKVEKSESDPSTDLQLPQATIDANAERDRLAAEAARAAAKAEKIEFKTKTVPSLQPPNASARGPATITFNKRKITSGANTRGRADDS